MNDSLPLWAAQLAVFDTETTGVETDTSRIVSATLAILGENGEISERYDWLLNPGVEIPDSAVRVHGITTDVARSSGIDAGVGIAQITERIAQFIERGLPLVVYNAPYDLSLLAAEQRRYGVPGAVVSPVLDPLIIDKQLDRFRKGKRTLVAVAEHYGVELGNAHDAGEDAIASGKVMQQLARKYATTLPDDLEALHAAQATWARAQAENFQEYMRRVRDPNFVADGAWPVRG
ncbi:exonuclease domain-containing protein [Leucobacter aridicollis]|uniref:exonuclease domain-containing protein n=1 Tax=Leucobacter aridicollis TaxID=283878 RepID=UPI000E654F15|nr:exonuclease domain-containing protein [Leucobacter aridicollis]UTX54524.1 3'-5' exonuclease [Leucobacter aridicollis]